MPVGPEGDAVRLTVEQANNLGITTVRAEAARQAEFVAVQGSVIPQSGSQVSVFAPFSGILVAREGGFPAAGQRVEQNEALADMEQPVEATDTTQMSDQRKALDAEIDRLRQELDQSAQELERTRKLFESGMIPRKQVEQAEFENRQAQGRLEEALKSKASYDRLAKAEIAPLRVELRAPITGVVQAVYVDPGKSVDASTAVFQIVDLDEVWVEARIQEEYVPLARESRKAEIAMPGPNPQVQAAQLLSSSPAADTSHRGEVAIYAVGNREGILAPGMQVEVRLPVSIDQTDRPVCRIPSNAIFRDGNAAAVFVELEPGVYRLRRIATGFAQEGFTAVIKGLEPGDSVVVAGLAALRDRLK